MLVTSLTKKGLDRTVAEVRCYSLATRDICSPQHTSECGIALPHGHPFSYTRVAPQESQTYLAPTSRDMTHSFLSVRRCSD